MARNNSRPTLTPEAEHYSMREVPLNQAKWAAVLALPRTPLCPSCGMPLDAAVADLAWPVAFCAGCAWSFADKLHDVVKLMRTPELAAQCVVVNGLIFWCPKPHHIVKATAFETYAVLAGPDDPEADQT